jgi:hypothetical protein
MEGAAMTTDGMNRRQRRRLDAARQLVGPDTTILAYGGGRGHARMSKGVVGLAAGFLVVFVAVLALLHAVLLPGGVLLIVGIGMIRPRRGVALTPDAVLLLHESEWNGKPNRLILRAAPVAFVPTGSGSAGSVSFQLGTERVTLKRREYERLLSAVQSAHSDQPLR